MKRFLCAVALAFALVSGAYAAETCSKTSTRKNGELPACLAFDAVVTNTTSAIIDTFGFNTFEMSVWPSEAASEVRIKIWCRQYSSDASGAQVDAPWAPCADDIVNPTNTAGKIPDTQALSLPYAHQYMFETSGWVSGTIYLAFGRSNR